MYDWIRGLSMSQTAPNSGEKTDPAELRVPKSTLEDPQRDDEPYLTITCLRLTAVQLDQLDFSMNANAAIAFASTKRSMLCAPVRSDMCGDDTGARRSVVDHRSAE
jgi:hypothetical protein